MLTEELHGEHAFTIGGFSPYTIGHQSVAKDMHQGGHSSVNVYTTTSTARPIAANQKVEFIKKATPKGTHVNTAMTPFHALSDMHKRGLRGTVTFYGGSDRANIVNRLREYNGKEGGHGYYKFDKINFKQVGEERSDDAKGLAGVSGSKARKAKTPEELKQYLPKELHKHATDIFNAINEPKPKKSIRERFFDNEIFPLMDLVETNTGDVGLIVYKGSNYVTLQLSEKNTVKAWLYDIKEAKYLPRQPKTVPGTKQIPITSHQRYSIVPKGRMGNQKIPALLMPRKDMLESAGQISYDDYSTKNFDICPVAQAHIRKVIANKNLNPKYVKQAIMALDKMFGIEKLAQRSSPNTTDVHDFTMYATIAHDTLNMLGYEDKQITYIDDHYKKFAKLINHHDGSLADEPSSHTLSSAGDLDEAEFIQKGRASPGMFKKITSADYELRTNAITGKQYKVKKPVISKGHEKIDNEDAMKDKKTTGPVYEQEEKKIQSHTTTSIDKVMGPDIMPGKPVGLHSFKAFLDITEPVRADTEDETQSAKIKAHEVGQSHGPAYKMMRKAKQMDL